MKSPGYLAPLLVATGAFAKAPLPRVPADLSSRSFQYSLDCSKADQCLREEYGDPDRKPTTPPPSFSSFSPFVSGSKIEMPEPGTTSTQTIEVVSFVDHVSSGVKSVAAAPQSVARSEALHGLKARVEDLIVEMRSNLCAILEAASLEIGTFIRVLEVVDQGYESVVKSASDFEKLGLDVRDLVVGVRDALIELDVIRGKSIPIMAYVESALKDAPSVQGYIRAAADRVLAILKDIEVMGRKVQKMSGNQKDGINDDIAKLNDELMVQKEIVAGRAKPVNTVKVEKARRFERFNERKKLRKILDLQKRLKIGYLSDDLKVSKGSKDSSLKDFELSNIALQAMELKVFADVDGVEMEVPLLRAEEWEKVGGTREARDLLMKVLSSAADELSKKFRRKKVRGSELEFPEERGLEDLQKDVRNSFDGSEVVGGGRNNCKLLQQNLYYFAYDVLFLGKVTDFELEEVGTGEDNQFLAHGVMKGENFNVTFRALVDRHLFHLDLYIKRCGGGENFVISFCEDDLELTSVARNRETLYQEEISECDKKSFFRIKQEFVDYLVKGNIIGQGADFFADLLKEFYESESIYEKSGDDFDERVEVVEPKLMLKKKVHLSKKAEELMTILKNAKVEQFKYQGKVRKAERRKWQDELVLELFEVLNLSIVPESALQHCRLTVFSLLREKIRKIGMEEKCDFEYPSFLEDVENSQNVGYFSVTLKEAA